MELNAGLIAGSHRKNEFVVIHCGGESSRQPAQHLSGRTCYICGDDVGLTLDGELFVACHECAFPICKTCYIYERSEGSQACPQCKTRFKRLKGCARVVGDEEEDDMDDFESEFCITDEQQNYHNNSPEAMLKNHMSYDSIGDVNFKHTTASQDASASRSPHPTDDCMQHFGDIQPERHALVCDQISSGSEKVHPPHHSTDPSLPVQPSSFDPSNDLTAQSQEHQDTMVNEKEQKDWDYDDEAPGLPLIRMDEIRQPLSRKIPIPSSVMNPYRTIIIIRLVIYGFFLHYRISHPVDDAYVLWVVSVMCEIWFAISWILDQFPKLLSVYRETYLDRLSLRYERQGQPSELSPIDIFVCTADPLEEPPLVIANTILSVLAVDYPADKVSCYVSDDGASILTLETLSETSEFARKWVPFCNKFNIEPRAPEWYFSEKIDYLEEKVLPAFVKERRAMKRQYEEFKVRINALVAKSHKARHEGWIMQDGTPWPGHNVRDHPGMIQTLLGQGGRQDVDGNQLPCLAYVSREKRPGFKHHKMAGAMNALVRVSAVLTNAPYLLHLDSGYYINNSKAIREGMCFMMDPLMGQTVCYVQFHVDIDGESQRTDRNIAFDINMKGTDGIQGPIYVGTGCVFRRHAIYGYVPKSRKASRRTWNCWDNVCCWRWSYHAEEEAENFSPPQKITNYSRNESLRSPACSLDGELDNGASIHGQSQRSAATWLEHKQEDKFGSSPVFIASTLLEDDGAVARGDHASLFKEVIHVISCKYEDRTEWGKEVGWIYGSVTDDILTGFKMHCHGWRSIYCVSPRPAFKCSRSINLFDRLHLLSHWALGSMEILLSRRCPLWYGYGRRLKFLERLSYINATIYPLTSIPLVAYCTLPAVCLLTGRFIIPELSTVARMWVLSLFISVFATALLEMKWSGVSIEDWWRTEQFWVVGGVSAHLFAVFRGLVKFVAGIKAKSIVTSRAGDDEFLALFSFKSTYLIIPPTTLLILNLIGIVVGISNAINNGSESWGLVLGKLLFAFWVMVHLYPSLKSALGRRNRTPTMIVVWSVLLASMLSLVWIRIDPFVAKPDGTVLEDCGLDCK